MFENVRYFSTAGIFHSMIFIIHKNLSEGKIFMHKKIIAGLIAAIMILPGAFAEEAYDPQIHSTQC